MAKSPIDLTSGALHNAIDKSKNIFSTPIDRIELIGSHILVDAGGKRIVYSTLNCQQGEFSEHGEFIPFVGGLSLELVHLSGPLPIPTVSGFWQRLIARLRRFDGRSIRF